MNTDKQDELISAVYNEIDKVSAEVADRNEYMNERERYLYGNGLMDDLEFPDGHDKTELNWLQQVPEIHSAQLMGRGFSINSDYNKIDLKIAEESGDEQQREQDRLMNDRRAADADSRKRIINSIIQDNGGMTVFKHGARLGSAFGETIFKAWLTKDHEFKYQLLETNQNYHPIWASDDFRTRTGDAYLYQISETEANRLYGDKLKEGQRFTTTPLGTPTTKRHNPEDSRVTIETNKRAEQVTSNPMVTVVEFTGIVPMYKAGKGTVVRVRKGQETNVHVLIVGDILVNQITDEDFMPRYHRIPNHLVPRRPFGEADITDTAMDINRTYVERISDWITLANKALAPIIQARGFEQGSIPKKSKRKMTIVPMDLNQTLEQLELDNSFGVEYQQILNELKENFIRAVRLNGVLFDNTGVDANSNQALMTLMKGTIDAVEDKQPIWEAALVNMFTDALELLTKHNKDIKEALDGDDDWELKVTWPSVLRREDPVFQSMVLNRYNTGTMSVRSFLESQGVDDIGEELDRLRHEYDDPVTAAILGKIMNILAQSKVAPPTDEGPDVKVSLRGDLTPYQEANLATQEGFNDGPFPPTAGPQGAQGRIAQENADNADFLQGNVFQGGTPIQRGPDGQPIPTQQVNTQANNQEGTGVASQPGTGQPAVSPEGAVAQEQQNRGV